MQTIPTEAIRKDATYLVAEASTCGLKPGEWPEALEVTTPDGWTCTYRKNRPGRDTEGDLVVMIYTTVQGEPELHILND